MKHLVMVRAVLGVLMFVWAGLSLAYDEFKIVSDNEIVAQVYGKKITRSEIESQTQQIVDRFKNSIPESQKESYRLSVFTKLVFKVVNSRLDKDCKINVSEQEVQSYLAFMEDLNEELQTQSDEEQEEQSNKAYAKAQWKNFYRFQCLYARYGGTVIFQQAYPFEPIGALRSNLTELESAGHLKIFDNHYRRNFWRYFNREYEGLPKDAFDFSKPWWQQNRK